MISERLNRLRIGVVCDFYDDINHLANYLRRNGVGIVEIVSIADIDNQISNYDILFVDLWGGDGCMLASRIREASSKIGILVIISEVDEMSGTIAFKSGADNYLFRPYRKEELLAIIGSLSRWVLKID
jgi:DNA-binding response OmpR family regulator